MLAQWFPGSVSAEGAATAVGDVSKCPYHRLHDAVGGLVGVDGDLLGQEAAQSGGIGVQLGGELARPVGSDDSAKVRLHLGGHLSPLAPRDPSSCFLYGFVGCALRPLGRGSLLCRNAGLLNELFPPVPLPELCYLLGVACQWHGRT